MSSIFRELTSTYSTWTLLSAYLKSEEGGRLRIDDRSIPENPFALIRYIKGQSDLSRPHVRAFRSVVWDTAKNRPVSVTPFKSEDGESLPETADVSGDYCAEEFVDGTLIGMFYDSYNRRWRIHTRSTLDAVCRYYSPTKTFADMFAEATAAYTHDDLDKTLCYSFILQHPENRIVVPVAAPKVYIVQKAEVAEDGAVQWKPLDFLERFGVVPKMVHLAGGIADLRTYVSTDLASFSFRTQGVVLKTNDGRRWKLRTSEYNRVRALRGNSPRRDYLWLAAWANGTLPSYLALYPEERGKADAIVNRWKQITGDVQHLYTDVFKARSLPRNQIPPKYRPLVYGLHTLYTQTLKPAGRTVDWKTTVQYMNERDTAQKLFVLNWELRQMNQQVPAPMIPVEPPVSVGTEVKEEA